MSANDVDKPLRKTANVAAKSKGKVTGNKSNKTTSVETATPANPAADNDGEDAAEYVDDVLEYIDTADVEEQKEKDETKLKKQKKQKKRLKRKKKMKLRQLAQAGGVIEQRYTIRTPEWTYLKLKMIYYPPYPKSQPSTPEYPPDALTWRTNISASLSQFLGIMGMAITVDILSLGGSSDRNSSGAGGEDDTSDESTIFVRIPTSDAVRFSAAVAAWASEREGRSVKMLVKASSEFAAGVCGDNGGRGVFD